MGNLEVAIAALSERVREHSETLQTEEAVKTSVVLPFLRALGYDVFDPTEVIPEYTADVVGKKGEKVDYAIQISGEIVILVECKSLSTQLSERNLAQLFRYFTVTSAKFAILTNGREFRFLTDLDEPNKLDSKPFFVFDLLDYNQAAMDELSKFARAGFDVFRIIEQAERLKVVSSVRRVLETWIESPSDALVRIVAGEIHDGRVTSEVREKTSKAIVVAFREIVRDQLRSRISSALEDQAVDVVQEDAPAAEAEIVTTEEEIEGWLTVKAILRGTVPGERIAMRDAKSYCAILLDDNNRKPLARLHFNRKKKYLGLFDGDVEDRVAISSLDQILEFADRIVKTAEKYTK